MGNVPILTRNNKTSPTISADYTYTYDDGGNLITKQTPWFDDFDDGNYTGWHVYTGTWSASNGYLEESTAGQARIAQTGVTDADYQLDNILVINDDLGTTATTFAHNNANELTSQTVNGVTTNFTYDDWGRTVSKYTDNTSADFTYAYGSKLQSATVDYPGTDDDATVTYKYGGDGKRRARTQGTGETWYNWGMGYNVISEEDDDGGDTGALTRTYIGNLGEVGGSNPAGGTYRYYHQDILGSMRALSDDDKTILGAFDHTPYGDPYITTGPTDVTHRYTGHDWDPAAGLYFAPYRHYSPNTAHWTTRDPSGMADGPNMFAYVMGNPILYMDPLGLKWRWPGWASITITVAGFVVGFGVHSAGGVTAGGTFLLMSP